MNAQATALLEGAEDEDDGRADVDDAGNGADEPAADDVAAAREVPDDAEEVAAPDPALDDRRIDDGANTDEDADADELRGAPDDDDDDEEEEEEEADSEPATHKCWSTSQRVHGSAAQSAGPSHR